MSDWLARLPHGPEFTYLSTVTAVEPGVRGSGVMSVDGTEPYFAGHFPGNPIVPGVLIVEGLAQLAGLIAWSDDDAISSGALAQIDVRMTRPVVPPAAIELAVDIERKLGPLARCNVTATVNGDVVSRGMLVLTGTAS